MAPFEAYETHQVQQMTVFAEGRHGRPTRLICRHTQCLDTPPCTCQCVDRTLYVVKVLDARGLASMTF